MSIDIPTTFVVEFPSKTLDEITTVELSPVLCQIPSELVAISSKSLLLIVTPELSPQSSIPRAPCTVKRLFSTLSVSFVSGDSTA